MYITNNPEIALIAEKNGVERIFVDLETLGKEDRQKNMNSVKSHHTVDDVKAVSAVLTNSEMLVRINPWHDNSVNEIEAVISAGADRIMLPMWKSAKEVSLFLNAVNGRVGTTLLLETKEAEACIDEVLELPLIDEIHIGLNDLHLSYGLTFMFELLTNGKVEMLCEKMKNAGIRYGFGGIARIGEGMLPAECVIMEHYRLGSTRAILSRSFCDVEKCSRIQEVKQIFEENMKTLRAYEETLAEATEDQYRTNRQKVIEGVKNVVDHIRRKAKINRIKEKLPELTENYGNAFYLLDSEQFRKNFDDLSGEFKKIYPHFNIAYSYKTNYTPKLCKIINEKGGYAEVVSDMELEIALRSGVRPDRIIWNGPVKNAEKTEELLLAGGTVNIDSVYELDAIEIIAKAHPESTLNMGIRCNFDVGDGVVSRFGFDTQGEEFETVLDFIGRTENVHLINIQCHFAKRNVEYWPARASGMVDTAKRVEKALGYLPDRIDIGGGLFGNMEPDLKAQFTAVIPSYADYAKAAATVFAKSFPDAKPELLIEPGSAMVGDCMKFVGRIETIKNVRGKIFATMLGSQKNISMSGVNPPMIILETGNERKRYTDVDIVGYTCIEGDVMFHGYSGTLAAGDYAVFSNCGSYSIVMKPPFIMPNFPILDICGDTVEEIKRKENFDDLFHTFLF